CPEDCPHDPAARDRRGRRVTDSLHGVSVSFLGGGCASVAEPHDAFSLSGSGTRLPCATAPSVDRGPKPSNWGLTSPPGQTPRRCFNHSAFLIANPSQSLLK